MMVSLRNKTRGFSLIETLVAAMLLSGGVVAICSLSGRSMTSVRVNREYETGWDVLDRQLTVIDYIGVEEFLQIGQMSGQFGSSEDGGGYQWAVEIEEEEIQGIYRVDITVSWVDGKKNREVSAATVLGGSENIEEEESSENNE
jgi:hypothetical protein